jgi:hypothetical protein
MYVLVSELKATKFMFARKGEATGGESETPFRAKEEVFSAPLPPAPAGGDLLSKSSL